MILNKRHFLLSTFALAVGLFSCTQKSKNIPQQDSKSNMDYVDPFIGTGGHVHTFPGATYPFGMIQLSPDGDTNGWDWCSGYHHSDTNLKGFSHTHLSGTGWSDLGDILLMPGTGDLKLIPGEKTNPDEGWRSRFSHDNETATPGYYQVMLQDYGINVELTANRRIGAHKYSFPSDKGGWVIIDPTNKIFGKTFDTKVTIEGSNKVTGFCHSTGWGGDRYVYFVAEFSVPFESTGVFSEGKLVEGKSELEAKDAKAYVKFAKTSTPVEVKVSISAVDQEGAFKNMKADGEGENFASILESTQKVWADKLSHFEIEGGTDKQKTIFFTGVYHNFMAPNLSMDADGRYVALGKVYEAKGFENYSTYSIWDTFRATHPLLSMLEPKSTADFANSLISRHRDAGHVMPLWELCGVDNTCMIGEPTIPFIYDALQQGVSGIDKEEALAAMVATTELNKDSSSDGKGGKEEYKSLGYVPSDVLKNTAKTLEYAYADWCIAELAEELGKKEIADKYRKRSKFYRNLFNEEKGYFWPKNRNGEWFKDFPLNEWEPLNKHWVSGNIWAYEYFTPHAVNDLIALKGGIDGFRDDLDHLFSTELNMVGDEHVDISGFIGGYAHGDEPGHSNAYLYNYVGQPYKTQALVRRLMDEMYDATIDGMINNEDCGQMSAWYLFSSMGFYPVCPGSNEYIIGSPLFDKVSMKLPSGKTFTVVAENQSEANVYIQSISIDGNEYTKSFITNELIQKGGTMTFVMGAEPNTTWASKAEDCPVSK